MDELLFRPGSSRAWASLGEGDHALHVTGWADDGDAILVGPALAKHLLTAMAEEDSPGPVLGQLAGNYAVAAQTPRGIHLAVDPVRSIPLLYREQGNAVVASDDAERLGAGALEVDQGAALEFLAGGYVLGPRTLRKGLSALQPGDCLSWPPGERRCRREEFFSYACTHDRDVPREQLVEGLEAAVGVAFRRTVRSLAGRQAVVPLSGGLDSRLVAASLRDLGYTDVVCFSYGLPGNWESERSRRVAEALGYRWVQVPYSGAGWRAAKRDPRMHAYWRFACNEVALPHIAEWMALHGLQKQGVVRRDAVFLPGHTGDFLSGGHLKCVLDPAWNAAPGDLAGAIVGKHLSLWEDLADDERVRAGFEAAVRDPAASRGASDEALAAAYERWEWRERQPKLVINGVRLYEFFGYGWRLPLWDNELMKFWRTVPLAEKQGKRLYRAYLASRNPGGVFDGVADAGPPPAPAVAARPLHGARWRTRKVRRHLADYLHHPLGYGRGYGFVRYVLRDGAKRHSDALLAVEVLARLHGVDATRLRAEALRPGGGHEG